MEKAKAQRQEAFSLAAMAVSIVISNLVFFLYIAPTA
jgi:hypothetical protein